MGFISYSAYLWHQPLLAHLRIRSLGAPSWELTAALALATFPLAYLTWRFIEIPTRAARTVSRPMVFLLSGGLLIGFVTFGAIGHSKYMDIRLDERQLKHMAARSFSPISESAANLESDPTSRPSSLGARKDPPELLVWGDSYSMHLMPGIRHALPEMPFVQMTMSACAPIPGAAQINSSHTPKWAGQCMAHNDRALALLRTTKSIRTVILSSPFRAFIDRGGQVILRDGNIVEGRLVGLALLRRTLSEITRLRVRVIIVSPTPASGYNTGACVWKAHWFNEPLSKCDFSSLNAYSQETQKFLSDVGKDYQIVWLDRAMCKNMICRASIDGKPIYLDAGHLTDQGSILAASLTNSFGLNGTLP